MSRHPDAPDTCDLCVVVLPNGAGHYTADGRRVCASCADLPADVCLRCLGHRTVEIANDVWATCDTCFAQGRTPVDDRDYAVATGVMRAAVERTPMTYTRERLVGTNFITDDVFGTFRTRTGLTVEVSTGIGIGGLRVYGVTCRPDDTHSGAVFSYDDLLARLQLINTTKD